MPENQQIYLLEGNNEQETIHDIVHYLSTYNIKLQGNIDLKFPIEKTDGRYTSTTLEISGRNTFIKFCMNEGSQRISSADFIYGTNITPTYTIYKDSLSIEQFAYAIQQFINSGRIDIYIPIQENFLFLNILQNKLLNEYRTVGALGKKNIGNSSLNNNSIRNQSPKNPVGRPRKIKVRIEPSKKEITPIKKSEESIYNEIMKQYKMTPDEQLDSALPLLVERLIKSEKVNGLIVLGTVGGTGKTWTVTHTMETLGFKQETVEDIEDESTAKSNKKTDNNDIDSDLSIEASSNDLEKDYDLDASSYIYFRGAVTVPGIYKLLNKYYNKIIVIDDSDNLFNSIGEGLLKGAMEEGHLRQMASVNARTTSGNSKTPPIFFFSGKIIFITNLTVKDIAQPIISRSFFIEIDFTPEELLERIHGRLSKLFEGNQNISEQLKLQVFKICTKLIAEAKKHGITIYIDFRTFCQGIELAATRGSIWEKSFSQAVLQKNKNNF